MNLCKLLIGRLARGERGERGAVYEKGGRMRGLLEKERRSEMEQMRGFLVKCLIASSALHW